MKGRIRTAKPEVLLDEKLWDLGQLTSPHVFQAFEGLWMFADREGRFEWRPRALQAGILPYWEGDFGALLDALAEAGFVQKYEVEGRTYGHVRNFRKHQRPNAREPESSIPAPPKESKCTHVQVDACIDKKVSSGKGREGEGEGNGVAPTSVVAQPQPDSFAHAEPEPIAPSAAVWAAYAEAYRTRYREPPIRNAKVNGQLAQLVRRLPAAEAPDVVRHYLRSNNGRYVASGHSVGCLLQDAEKLRTEWATSTHGTAFAAREADKLAGRGDQHRAMLAALRAEDEADALARLGS